MGIRAVTIPLLAAIALVGSAIAPRSIGAQGTLSALETDVDHIARIAAPSVVTVVAQRSTVRDRGRSGTSKRLHTRVGSGVAIGGESIITTASVVLGAERVMVRTQSGVQVEGQVRGIDLVYNIAVVQAEGLRLPPIRLAEALAQPGDWVIALGTSYRGQPTQSVGNVATIYPDPRQPLLQLTNVVYPGNSGGAALNARGELIGLVQGELGTPEPAGRGPDSNRRPGGMSFVLPSHTLQPALESLLRDGRVPHGFLGVSTSSASVESEAEPGVRVPIGALVENVQSNGPAMKAGLRRGDLIVGFDRERVEYADHLARWVSSTRPGAAIDLVWVRDEVQQRGRIVLGESTAPSPQWAEARPDGAVSPTRAVQIERQIQKLNLELDRLKSDTPGTRR